MSRLKFKDKQTNEIITVYPMSWQFDSYDSVLVFFDSDWDEHPEEFLKDEYELIEVVDETLTPSDIKYLNGLGIKAHSW